MNWVQFAALIAGLLVSVIAIIGFLTKTMGGLAAKYRKPFDELHKRVDNLEEHRPKCESRFEALEGVAGLEQTVRNHTTYLSNDREAIVEIRRDANDRAKEIGELYNTVSELVEGVHLCMQHEVKGNHVDLLEKWMRDNAASSVKRKEKK